VAALTEASPQFAQWWAEYPVRYFRPATIAVKHPGAGVIGLQMFQLRLVDQPDLIMVIQIPADETSLARVRSLPAEAAPAGELARG
jgi:MmyB-like transcription regulator ligand binding domain